MDAILPRPLTGFADPSGPGAECSGPISPAKRTWWDGGERAFEAFVVAHRRRVLGLLGARLGCPEEAEDLTQEVFLRAWRSRDRWRPGRDPWPWLAAIAMNAARDHHRHRARRPRETADETRLENQADESCPREAASHAERLMQVRKVIDEMPERQREVLLLATHGGLAPAQIAQALEITANAARVTLHRARQALRRALEAHDHA
jgi:RNA polymerase sigma-70 factor (ECF subfamily)